MDDNLIVEYTSRHPKGDDPYSDAANYPYTFLKGYRDAEEGIPKQRNSNWSIAEANAYALGRYEYATDA
jgi:hypothetical protein